MALIKLLGRGDIIDPDVSRIASIVVRKMGDQPPPHDGSAVMVMAVSGNMAQMHVMPFANDAEAETMRDVVAAGLGWNEKSQIIPAGKDRQ